MTDTEAVKIHLQKAPEITPKQRREIVELAKDVFVSWQGEQGLMELTPEMFSRIWRNARTFVIYKDLFKE